MEQRSYNTMAMGRNADQLTKDEDDGFCGKRTRVEQILIVVSTILAILSISLIIAIIVISSKEADSGQSTATEVPATTAGGPEGECTTEVCKFAADKLKASIDNSVDPCDDFYSYVCSGWIKDNEIPNAFGSYSTFTILNENITNELKTVLPKTTFDEKDVRTKTKIFYQSCIDYETRESKGVEDLKNVLQKLGGWPLLGDKLKDYTWEKALVYAITELSISPIIATGVDVDAKNTNRYIILLDQTSLGIGRNELLSNASDERTGEMMSAYKSFIKKSAKILDSKKNDAELNAEIEEMVEFEKKLAQYTRSEEDRRDPQTVYTKFTIGSLQSFIKKEINLLSFLDNILNNITKVTEDTEIIVSEVEYLYETLKLLSSNTIKEETIANYIGWSMVQAYGSTTNQEFRDAELEFGKVVSGVKESKPLDESCIGTTNVYFDFALGSIYINNDFDIGTKSEIENMVAQLKNAFGELLKDNTWMNDESKKEAENKLNQMIAMIGYPPWVNDAKELNDYYEELGDIKDGDFFGNILSVLKFVSRKEFKKLNEPHNRTTEWASAPAIVNAFYSPNANTITFPAGILKFPFYQVGLPISLNYAGIGSVIGHEITHGFDDEGRQFDAEGNMKDWWPAEVKEKFKTEAQCFVDQYGNYIEPLTGMKLNGENTLGENIADNGGIRESFKAYKAIANISQHNLRLPGLDLTPDQLFFVGYSYVWCSKQRKEYLQDMIQYNPHSPSQFRVQGPCSNFKEFATTFNCPAGSTMNPEKRCLLW